MCKTLPSVLIIAADEGHDRPEPYELSVSRRIRPRGRPTAHRHKTLILNGSSQPKTPSDAPATDADAPGSNNTWVTKNDRHLQLINTAVYEKETQVRSRAIEQTRLQKQAARDERERLKFMNHLSHTANHVGAAKASSAAAAAAGEARGRDPGHPLRRGEERQQARKSSRFVATTAVSLR